MPALIEGLKGDERQAYFTTRSIAVLGPVAKDALPELSKHLDSKNVYLQFSAAAAIARIDSVQAPKMVEMILKGLKDNKKAYAVRTSAMFALWQIGPAAKKAIPTLEQFLDDEERQVHAALTMLAIDPDSKVAREWISKAFKKIPSMDAHDLVDALEDRPAEAKLLIPDLIGLLNAKHTYYRSHAASVLGNLGADAKDALPSLKKVAESDPLPDVRETAREAIKKIEK